MKKKNIPAKVKNIYISSIHQNAGKTMVSLGLYNLMKEKKMKTAFMKPVGQQTVEVDNLNVDKDTYLMGEVYRCRQNIKAMSPITVPHGYTQKYIMNPQKEELREKIFQSYQQLIKGNDSIILEGTGHAGVGSVIDLSNAQVAKLLDAKVIIVSEGGIGRSIDEIMLNKALFDLLGVETIGVIINKVLPEKYKKIKRILKEGLRQKGLRLLGVIPLEPLLSRPTIKQVMNELKLHLLCGQVNLGRRIKNTIVAAMEPHNMVNYLSGGTLVLTSGDRVDNIMVAVSAHLVMQGRQAQVSGIILSRGLVPNNKILSLLRKSKIPILVSDDDTYTVAGKIENFICKIQKTDKDKILGARKLVKEYVDINSILKSF